MKIKLFTAIIIAIATIAMTACNEFELNEHMLEACFMVHGGEYNKQDSTTRRAWMTLMVTGLNEDPYTVEYKIDGNNGIGQFALEIIDEETKTLVYNNQIFKGSEYMSEEMFSGVYDGNFPTGSNTTLHFLNTRSGKHPSTGSVSFLSPKLDAGKHIIEYVITNSYGEIVSGSREFTIQNKPIEND